MKLINKVKGKVKDLTSGSDPLQEMIHKIGSNDPQHQAQLEKERLVENIVRRLKHMDQKSLQKHVDALIKDDYKSFYSDIFFQMEKINYLEARKAKEDAKVSLEASRIEKQSENEEGKSDNNAGLADELQAAGERIKRLEDELQRQYQNGHELREKLRGLEEALMHEKEVRENDQSNSNKKIEASFKMLREYELRNTGLEKENANLKENSLKLKNSLEKQQVEHNVLTESLRASSRKMRELKITLKKGEVKSEEHRY